MTRSTRSRTAALAALLALALAAGGASACGGDEEEPGVAKNSPTGEPTADQTAQDDQQDTQDKPDTQDEEGASLRVQVKDNEPVGDAKELTVKKGDPVEITVEADKPTRIHLHGYEVINEARPGAPAVFDFDANLEGLFTMEVEETGTTVAELEVTP